ncbi:MAG: hypothetical protein Ta2A_14730 [Treponemataceae bacterium]|nr:MAG: hypothetical protein Ta2A_14730 [Treponemataceae bacterium]
MQKNKRFFRFFNHPRLFANVSGGAGVALIVMIAMVAASVITCTSHPAPKVPPQNQEIIESAEDPPASEKKSGNTIFSGLVGEKNIFAGLFGKKKDVAQKTAETAAKKATSAQAKAASAEAKEASAQAKAKRLAEKKAQQEKLVASLNMLDEAAVDTRGVKLQNPVLLVHAEGVRDAIFEQNMWGALPQAVIGAGVNVYFAGTDSWGTIESNGAIIKDAIAKISNAEGGKRINIIAFGKGGLDARYAINTLDAIGGTAGANKIASLTTISTAHRGVKALDTVRKIPEPLKMAFAFFVNTAAKVQGDKTPDFLHSQQQLSESVCTKFNADFPNKKNVLYISYFSKPKYEFLNTKTLFLSPLIRAADKDKGENDTNNGFCPLSSAKWGNFKGTIQTSMTGALNTNTFALVLNNIQKAGL